MRINGFWHSLGSLFKVNSKPKADETFYQRESKKHEAWRAVLLDGYRATDEHRQIVLADLLNFCGHMQPRTAGEYSTDQLWQEEGKRQVALYVIGMLDLPEADLRALQQAARREAAVTDLDRVEEPEGLDLT